jgi:hypothetical protein
LDKKYKTQFLKLKTGILLFLAILFFSKKAISQLECKPASSNFNFVPTPSNINSLIDWDKFPVFSLPFKIVFCGPRFNDQNQQPLKHGFSHLATFSGADSATLPVKNRALLYYGIAYNFNRPQPWQTIRSPWGNDIIDYRNKWRGDLAAYSYLFNDSRGTRAPAADLLILDIERHWEGEFQLATDLAILAIKKDPKVPSVYSQLSDNQFIDRYKRDMLKLYSEPLDFMRKDGLLSKFNKISSYGDVPIRFQGLNIEGNQWAAWQTNTAGLSYLMKDTLTAKLGGSFYDQLDFLCPSAYVQADYAANPKTRGGNYLSEILFQIEVNRAWSKKEIMPFIWLRYEDFSLQYPRFVKPFQAEALAIFPFMAGANGVVLWEDSFDPSKISYNTYEYYINGLYKLSLYKSFFEGANEFVQAENARDLNAKQLPIWRGVVKDNKILIAAQNPYAADNEVTKLKVFYKNWYNTISLKGKETFLCVFDLFTITGSEPLIADYKFALLDNPINANKLRFKLELPTNETFNYSLKDMKGNIVYSENYKGNIGENRIENFIPKLNKGVYLFELQLRKGNIIKKVIY